MIENRRCKFMDRLLSDKSFTVHKAHILQCKQTDTVTQSYIHQHHNSTKLAVLCVYCISYGLM